MAYIVEKQFSLFDDPEPEDPSGITRDQINKCLMGGSGFVGGKLRIFLQYEKIQGSAKNAEFLKKEYGTGGRSPAYMCRPGDPAWHTSMDYDPKGIRIRVQQKELLLTWPDVAKRIQDLVESGEYFTESDEWFPCYSCIFQQNGYCEHIDKCSRDEYWYCHKGSFRIEKDRTCSKCGRKIKLKDIQQADMGSDSYQCPKCGQVTIFNNQGNRPSAMDLWEAGKLIGT